MWAFDCPTAVMNRKSLHPVCFLLSSLRGISFDYSVPAFRGAWSLWKGGLCHPASAGSGWCYLGRWDKMRSVLLSCGAMVHCSQILLWPEFGSFNRGGLGVSSSFFQRQNVQMRRRQPQKVKCLAQHHTAREWLSWEQTAMLIPRTLFFHWNRSLPQSWPLPAV